MRNVRVLSGLTILVGLLLAVTPWVFRFTSDWIALLDVAVGGLVVAMLGLIMTYMVGQVATRPHSSH
jgi:uncharacterized protein involved in cysteine biosynthesis